MKTLVQILREARNLKEDLASPIDAKDVDALTQAVPNAVTLSKTGNKKVTFNQKAVQTILARLAKMPDKKRFLYSVDNKTLMHIESFLRELISNGDQVSPEVVAAAKKMDDLLANRFYA